MLLPPCPCRAPWRVLLPVLTLAAALLPAAPARADDWKEIGKTPTLTIYDRAHAGSSYKEVKAVGTFDAPNWVIKNVLDDTEHYASFMPYVVESRLLARDPAKHTIVAYARVNPPVVSTRDYAITVHDDSQRSAEGAVYKTHWEPATDPAVPAEKPGVVRVKNNQGSWLLEPAGDGQKTKGTYILYTDGGGGIPAFLVNSLNKKRLTELFEGVEKASKNEKYKTQGKPVYP